MNFYSIEDNSYGELTQFISEGNEDIILKAASEAKIIADNNYDDYISWKNNFYNAINKILLSNNIKKVVEIKKNILKN